MVAKNARKPEEDFLDSAVDEGWWSSILKDETIVEHNNLQPSDSLHQKESNGIIDWERIQDIFQRDEIVILRVHGYNRGGLLVQGNGIQGFLPVSHLVISPENLENEERRRNLLSKYLGKALKLKVIECVPAEERVVFSERAAKAGEGTRKQLLLSLQSGDKITGIVTNVTDFGAFVDLGGVEGLIHVSELSWGRVQHPLDILFVGQKIQAMVLSVSEGSSRVALSLKQLSENPWTVIGQTITPGDLISVKVTAIMRYGVFVKLDQGVEGLIHITGIRMPPGIKDIKRFIRIGQVIRARVLHLDIERRRLGLAMESL